ncbi:hypothetical protein [Paenarthrobacter sp. PH39-S1]|uniref:hypothetical protein n=1 Tax=Paenarthrobacter sp. PH39-S1 TaxID=3046204 RepID=UPI0024BB5322|nr:hypothetical protein [Paenarthrobacter sp. PH39-S1]MDJ0355615.1 hypothetical protein [Paenarthrobacter sp. PH39-S1]
MTENPRMQDAQTSSYGATPEATVSDSTTDAVKGEAADMTHVAAHAAGHVAETAKDETTQVVSEVAFQAKDLLAQVRTDLVDQADAQQQRLAGGLRSVADELHSMANSSDQSGTASDLVRQTADRSASLASWLEGRNPGSLLEEVRGFARQRPVAFLALACGVGILAGRLTRGLSAGASSGGTANGTLTTPVRAVSPVVAPAPVQPYGAGDVYVEPTLAAGEAPVSTAALPGTPDYLAPETESFPDDGRYR